MKKGLICLALAAILALTLCACGESQNQEMTSPYAGVWTATSARYGDTEVAIGDVFPDGLSLELQDNGVCQLTLGEDTDPATWSVAEDDSITISDGETDLLGTVDGDVIVLEISGMSITLTREGADTEGDDTQDADAPEEETAEE